jgi:TolB protein
VFRSERDGTPQVYVMNPDGCNPRNLTNNPARDYPPGWSADGAWILFRSTRDRAAHDVYRMKADGTEVTRVTNTANVR